MTKFSIPVILFLLRNLTKFKNHQKKKIIHIRLILYYYLTVLKIPYAEKIGAKGKILHLNSCKDGQTERQPKTRINRKADEEILKN